LAAPKWQITAFSSSVVIELARIRNKFTANAFCRSAALCEHWRDEQCQTASWLSTPRAIFSKRLPSNCGQFADQQIIQQF